MSKSDIAISVRGLGKSYLISHQAKGVRARRPSFRETLGEFVRSPFRRVKKEKFWALNDVSFEVKKGDVVGIIGRNGAGKSTLLKILSRITKPTGGEIDVYGRVGSLLEVGTGFHPELTGRENIFLNGAILGMSRGEIKRQFDAIVDFAEVESFLDTPVKRYSSGMYVRLAFAVAAHLNPEILVIDEVLAVGDSLFQKKCLGKMKDVATAGRTVLFVSHNMGTVQSLCNRCILLSDGTVARSGPTREVADAYMSLGAGEKRSVQWADPEHAPGSAVARLRMVQVLSGENREGDVPIDQPITIEFDYWNLKEGAELSTSIHLLDRAGVEVLSTANFPSSNSGVDEWFGRKYPVGLYRARCTIPANFLNEGTYSVNVVVMDRVSIVEIFQREVVTFTVADTGAMRREWTGGWIGVVRPKLPWVTEYLGNGVESPQSMAVA